MQSACLDRIYVSTDAYLVDSRGNHSVSPAACPPPPPPPPLRRLTRPRLAARLCRQTGDAVTAAHLPAVAGGSDHAEPPPGRGEPPDGGAVGRAALVQQYVTVVRLRRQVGNDAGSRSSGRERRGVTVVRSVTTRGHGRQVGNDAGSRSSGRERRGVTVVRSVPTREWGGDGLRCGLWDYRSQSLTSSLGDLYGKLGMYP